MAACRAELTVNVTDLERVRIRVVDDERILGFHGVEGDDLTWMFVAPAAMGRGIGAGLFADACSVARAAGIRVLRIEADPFAAGFYEHMGARRVGEVPSGSIPGRVLPLYTIVVA
jgi:GNAT superfamily N-acetyltransferase